MASKPLPNRSRDTGVLGGHMQPVTEGNPERPRLGLGSSPSTGRPLSHRRLTARHGRVADSAWPRRPLPARPARRPAPGTSSSFCPGRRWQHFAGMPFPRPLGAFRGFHRGSLVAQDFLPDRPSHSGPPSERTGDRQALGDRLLWPRVFPRSCSGCYSHTDQLDAPWSWLL